MAAVAISWLQDPQLNRRTSLNSGHHQPLRVGEPVCLRHPSIGLRTALVTPVLCAKLAGVPDVDTGFFPPSPRLLAPLDAAAKVASPALRPAVRTVASYLRAHPAATGASLPLRVAQSLDRLLIHRRAC